MSESDLRWAKLRQARIDATTLMDDKWKLVWHIVTHGAAGENLSEKDLSWANLRFANMSGANLSGANLSEADLGKVNLSGG